MAAVLGPVIHTASSETWSMVILMSAAALLLGKWVHYGEGWILCIQRIWAALLIAFVMEWSNAYWEGQAFTPAVPYILLALAVWTTSVKGKTVRIGCVLLIPLALLLGGVLLSGVPEVRMEYLEPSWYLPDPMLFSVLLLPNLHSSKRSHRWILPGGALAASVVTVGVLSEKISLKVSSGIYELSRSLSFLGLAERFESLVAAAMTMGFYLSMTYLLEPIDDNEKTWPYGLLAVPFYLLVERVGGWLLAFGSILMWVILPAISSSKNFLKKWEKGVDKSRRVW